MPKVSNHLIVDLVSYIHAVDRYASSMRRSDINCLNYPVTTINAWNEGVSVENCFQTIKTAYDRKVA